jgi:hypothetical protein
LLLAYSIRAFATLEDTMSIERVVEHSVSAL